MAAMTHIPDSNDIRKWMEQGESERIEFFSIIPSTTTIARTLAAIANTQGGVIVFGIQDRPARVTGITSWSQVSHLSEIAGRSLSPTPETIGHELRMPDGKTVGVFIVSKSNKLVVGPTGIFVREGASTKALSSSEILARVTPKGQQPASGEMTEMMAQMLSAMASHHASYEYGQSWRGQWKNWLISGLIGAVVGMPAGFLMSLAASYKYTELTTPKLPTPTSQNAPPTTLGK